MIVLKLDLEGGNFTAMHFEQDGKTVDDAEALQKGFMIQPGDAHWFYIMGKMFIAANSPWLPPETVLAMNPSRN